MRGDTPADAVPVLDVSRLPTSQLGSRNVVWWGTLAFIATEGTVFALLAAAYLYVWTRHLEWPPPGTEPPDPTFGSIATVLFLLSAVPNQWVKRAAERQDLPAVRVWLLVCLALAAAILIVRIWEFPALECRWSDHVYGSLVWALLGFHTLHLLTDFGDTAVLAALTLTRKVDSSRFGDVSDNALYWYFVVLAWLPIYALVYWAPRLP